MKLTFKLLHSAGSYGGNGFNAKQLHLLGVGWPPRQGWLRRLVGREIPDATWRQVMELKGRAKWVQKREKFEQRQASQKACLTYEI